MKCPYCNTDNPPGETFCSNCGGYLDPAASSTSQTIVTNVNTVNNANAPTLASTGSTTLSGSGASGNSRTLVPGAALQNGRYVIQKILGQGGMGAALLAKDTRVSNKQVVIKELVSDNTDPKQRQEDVRNFEREVETLSQIDHPLVPNVTDSFQEGTRYFMVQEYAAGENLEDRMERLNKPMPEREVLAYASQILDVLDYLSQQTPPIIHRDIKPANIIIGAKNNRAYLVDFGIARADIAKNAKHKQTSALGTPGYAPPEQYQGNADQRSDLYALAATMHHLLTNRDPRNYPPFAYPSVRSLNPQLSTDIDHVLTHALTIDVNKRYQTAAEMKQDIDNILAQRFGIGNTSTYIVGASGPITNPGTAAGNVTRTSPANPANPANPPTPIPISRPQPAPTRQQPTYPPPPAAYAQPPRSYPQRQAGAYASPPVQARRRGGINWVGASFLLLLLVVVIIAGLLFLPGILNRGKSTTGGTTTATATPTLPPSVPNNGIGVTKVGNDPIGISDGTVALDTNRSSGSIMQQAATALKNGDNGTAVSLWNQAVSNDTSNAEALIYLENQRVLTSGSKYITLVVATMLTGADADVGVGRDNLQGAYVAQKQWNDGAKLGSVRIRLLIANAGSSAANANIVAQQIVKAAKADSTIVGVMGWPYSGYTLDAVKVFTDAQIPLVSQTASSDDLTNISPYFFRVAPSNLSQAQVGANYAQKTLGAKNIALFYDPANTYSRSLADDFRKSFTAQGGNIVVTEQYTVGNTSTLSQSLDDALKHSPAPDLIYFSGYSNDVSTILTNLPGYTNFPNMKVMGGDALYNLGGYPSSARAGFNRLRFTTFAYPDEWSVLNLASQKPQFFDLYANTYDPNRANKGSPYGFTRADNNVILSYDATVVMLSASSNLIRAGQNTFTPSDLQQALTKINGSNAIQGVSGQISFGSDGNPINKAVVILSVSSQGFIQMEQTIGGTFLKK